MSWDVLKEVQRKYADESYFLKAESLCAEGKLVLEINWVQMMYALTIDLVKTDKEPELVFDCMIFCDDKVEKYGHQIMRITDEFAMEKVKRLDLMQKDGVLNYYLSEKYDVTYKTDLPVNPNA